MEENITKIIKDKFDALPESIQEVILSSNYQETLIEVGKQYHLNVEQLGILERETTLVMMGLTPTKDFGDELIRELNVEKENGYQIVKDINEKVFLKIRELLKLMNTPEGEEPSLEEEVEKPTQVGFIQPKPVETKEEERESIGDQSFIEHGIEIIPEKLEITGTVQKPVVVMPAQKIQPTSILTQKMSGPVNIPTIKTEHTLPNLSGNNVATPKPPTSKPAADPYREIPE